MSFGMNSGYSGWSMSNRAVAAYENGEMPKSKWTKKAMIAALKDSLYWSDDSDEPWAVWDASIEKMKKDEIFELFFEYKSWHHCSKFCNEVDFYGVDEDALMDHLKHSIA